MNDRARIPGDHGGPMADAAARRQLKADLARHSIHVHQPDDPPLFTREPAGPMQSVFWRWADLEPLLERLGREVALNSGGQRRTLRLANPGLTRGTTYSFWGSIQLILPGEIAEAHRHSANAFRFIMKGSGCSTTVDGECHQMNEGDLVLTPSWTWHDHEHRGSGPMIFLDVLDVALMHNLDFTFFEPYGAPTQPVDAVSMRSVREWGTGIMKPPGAAPVPARNPLLAYPRATALQALDLAAGLPADPCDDLIREYQNPATGGPCMPTQSMTLQRLRPGFAGRARRHTGSRLYYMVDGCGWTEVDGVRHDWSAGDFLSVRPWAWVRHGNDSGADAHLFQVNDTPILKALGFHREEIAPAT